MSFRRNFHEGKIKCFIVLKTDRLFVKCCFLKIINFNKAICKSTHFFKLSLICTIRNLLIVLTVLSCS